MKTNIKTNNAFRRCSALVAVFVAVLTAAISCSVDMNLDTGKNGGDRIYMATTAKSGEEGFNYVFRADGGYNLFPVSLPSTYVPTDGQRVMLIGRCIYSISLNESDSAFFVSQIADVLTKDIAVIKGQGTNPGTSLGSDPITPVDIWTGGGYINITFRVTGTNAVTHIINLAYDPDGQENLPEGAARLLLLHDAKGDNTNGYPMDGVVSFKLGEKLPNEYYIRAETLDDGIQEFKLVL